MIRIGIIGLDSTHALEFTRAFNAGIPDSIVPARVVAACAGADTDFPLSTNRRESITRELRDDLKIPLLNSTGELARTVDAIMILSCDGRQHRAEISEILSFGKPIFIDKPLSADWRDAARILEAARRVNCPCFSASALRYRAEPVTEIFMPHCQTHFEITVPRREEPGHPDLTWYGIHGIESAFALVGPGCLSVQRHLTPKEDTTTGRWPNGSTVRIRRTTDETARNFPASIRSATRAHRFEGYDYTGLLRVMADFFHSGISPLTDQEIIEPLAFAAAADASRDRQGAEVNLPDFLAEAAFDWEFFSRSG